MLIEISWTALLVAGCVWCARGVAEHDNNLEPGASRLYWGWMALGSICYGLATVRIHSALREPLVALVKAVLPDVGLQSQTLAASVLLATATLFGGLGAVWLGYELHDRLADSAPPPRGGPAP